jgi:hypothetical protein
VLKRSVYRKQLTGVIDMLICGWLLLGVLHNADFSRESAKFVAKKFDNSLQDTLAKYQIYRGTVES